MTDDTHPDLETHRVQHHRQEPVTTTVVLAVAELDGVDPTAMEPLYEAVDPALLEALDGGGPVSADVTFDYRGYRVTVDSDGGVAVVPRVEVDVPPDRTPQ